MSEDLEKLGLPELFDMLVPPEAPADISMTPQTAGWLWLAAALVLAIGFGLWKWLAHRRANAYRRQALSLIKQRAADPRSLASLLRETALAAYPRPTVAGLIGEDWLRFLDQSCGQPLFVQTSAGRALLHGPYQATSIPDQSLAPAVKLWIQHHKSAQDLAREDKE